VGGAQAQRVCTVSGPRRLDPAAAGPSDPPAIHGIRGRSPKPPAGRAATRTLRGPELWGWGRGSAGAAGIDGCVWPSVRRGWPRTDAPGRLRARVCEFVRHGGAAGSCVPWTVYGPAVCGRLRLLAAWRGALGQPRRLQHVRRTPAGEGARHSPTRSGDGGSGVSCATVGGSRARRRGLGRAPRRRGDHGRCTARPGRHADLLPLSAYELRSSEAR